MEIVKKTIEYNDKNNQNDVKDSKVNVFIGFVRTFSRMITLFYWTIFIGPIDIFVVENLLYIYVPHIKLV